ncbi:MAG: type II toxin-antitoxin system VapC family toxin [Treponema sp.]|nr:type II toxin-antitoxin system VapC family toxin [Treponema sp.]
MVESEKKSVYIETTIPSYATAKPSENIIVAGKQAATRLFWEQGQHEYDFVTGEEVLKECQLGDAEAAERRKTFLIGIPVLPKTQGIIELADVYQSLLKIPEKAKLDCLHLATCVVARVDYLLTWNCAHLGHITYSKMRTYNDKHGLWTPFLVTPEDLIGRMEESL